MKTAKILSFAALTAAMAFTSCNKDDDNNNNPSGGSGSPNTMKVRMTDSPGNFSAFNTSVTKVEAYMENQGWMTIDSSNHSMNVLSLTNGTETTLATKSSPMAGHYTKLRLTMGANSSMTLNDQSGDSNHSLTWAGSTGNMVEVPVDINVSSGSGANILLDYNVGSSISGSGSNYLLSPMITWIQNESTGVKGDINGAVRGMITFTNGLHTYSTYMSNQGMFLIRGMEAGTYTMIIDGQASANSTTSTMQQPNVVIANGQINNMGAISFQ